jgi:Tfp pilus assembly protein PilO
MNSQLRRSRILGIIGLGVLAILLWQVVLAPGFSAPADVQKNIDQVLSLKATLDEETSTLSNRARMIGSAQQEAEVLATLLPESAALPELYQEVARLAKAQGIGTGNIIMLNADSLISETAAANTKNGNKAPAPTPTPSATAGAAATPQTAPLEVFAMKVTLKVNGSYAQLGRFANSIATSKRALAIDKASIYPANGSTYTLEMSLRAFATKSIGDAPVVAGVKATTSTPAATPTPTASN